MKTYQSFATALTALLGADTALRLRVEGYMPLSIEVIGTSADGNRLVSLCHYGEQNGDLMRDPEMVFRVIDWEGTQLAEPISFWNDYVGIHQEVYRYNDEGKATHVDARLKSELKSFARLWFRNLKNQGFLSAQATRERLS